MHVVEINRQLVNMLRSYNSVLLSFGQIRRCRATLAPTARLAKAMSSSPVEEIRWEEAKPFDQIPGAKALPVIGTLLNLMNTRK